MQRVYFNFDYRKATQALNFFSRKEGGVINKMKALKLVYFADRYHLRKYGRFITNDVYFAMQYGPVPSAVKDIAEASDFLDDNERDYSLHYIKSGQLVLHSMNIVENEVFSETDLESLSFAWDTFGHLNQFELAELTHEYPEWKKHEQVLHMDSRVQMQLEDFLKDPDTSANKCFELNEEDKVARSDHLAEMAHIESLWN